MGLDFDLCYRAVCSRDQRFDGYFFTAVRTTGIYCRPSCPAITPKRCNVEFHPSAASAHGAGFRACKRCRPDATPSSPEWNSRSDVVGRAMRLISDGYVDRFGVAGLARALSYSPRQLDRLLTTDLGAGPLALARARRAQTARLLIETTGLAFSDVAFASGFSSIRQFNDTVRAVFASTPSQLRDGAERPRPPLRRADHPASPGGAITVRLAYRTPCELAFTFGFLADRAIPTLECADRSHFTRSLSLTRGAAVMALEADPGGKHVLARFALDDLSDLAEAVQAVRRLLDLDADPETVSEHLGPDPVIGALVRAHPGRRVPGHPDGNELAVRAILGQQISLAGARRLTERLVQAHGDRLKWPVGTHGEGPGSNSGPGLPAAPVGALTHRFPSAATLAGLDPGKLAMPRSRAVCLVRVCEELATGALDLGPGADRDVARARLEAIPGIGPWTSSYISMRALGDPDAFLASDLGVRRALDRLGTPSAPGSAARLAQAWRPWRSYAMAHLWAMAPSPGDVPKQPIRPARARCPRPPLPSPSPSPRR